MNRMRHIQWTLGLLAAFSTCASQVLAQPTPTYSVVAQIPGPGGSRDAVVALK